MGPRRLLSARWPLLLLLASSGFATLGVIEDNRAIRSQRRVAEHALPGNWSIFFNTVLIATADERDYIIRG